MDAVEDIKSRLSVDDVVAQYVELKRAGRNFKGLSPFTSEKTPSFIVSPEKQIWHDFSSGKGGDMFTFVMEMEGLDFKGALEILARKAGIDLDQYRAQSQSGQKSQPKQRLYEVLEAATRFYQVQFSKNQKTLEYVLKKRQFTKETALAFRLGYAPNTGTALASYLKDKSFTQTELKNAGLITAGGIDMFRARLMIPLMDSTGRVVGFTARLLADNPNSPKYINTPGTVLYDKSRHVFGLNLAKDAIRKSGYAVVVEGNLDVIASHQAGVTQTVATAGTALTEAHLKTLLPFTTDVRLSFDQDEAGLQATERVIPLSSKVGISLSIISVPSGKDADELIKKDPALWQKAIDNHTDALNWLIERYKTLLDVTTATGKRRFSDVLLPVIGRLNDQVEQDHYLDRLSNILQVSKQALSAKLSTTPVATVRLRKPIERAKEPQDQVDQRKSQNQLLAICLVRADLREYLKPIDADMLPDDPAKTLNAFLKAHPEWRGDIKTTPELESLGDYGTMLVLQFEELYQDLETLELRYEAARLQARVIEHYVRRKKPEIARLLEQADSAHEQVLLKEVKQLDELLNTIKRS